MNEATCKAALVRLLREKVVPLGGIVYRHEDSFTGGIPDISINLNGETVWVEVKLDRPGRKSKLTALQSAALTALWGLEVHYAVEIPSPTGRSYHLSALVRDHRSGRVICSPNCNPALPVHQAVARAILERLVFEWVKTPKEE